MSRCNILAGAALARRHPEWALIDLPAAERDSLLVRLRNGAARLLQPYL